ncbi:hypothetical protein GCM10025789_05930 [Tessaracoccus lubricantis]|uniref:Uncharacterized protein n=1 Tax=Tessaracoccus lubricantis TaxID=545543 RepID=A0ABP9F398_9ACTN
MFVDVARETLSQTYVPSVYSTAPLFMPQKRHGEQPMKVRNSVPLDVGVVDDPVDHRGGDNLVSEHSSPAGEREVRGEDQGGVFVAG